MKRVRFIVLAACLLTTSAYAARQSTGQRLYSRLSLDRQQPRLLLPAPNNLEMSALSIEREPATGVTHLKGDVELRMLVSTYGLMMLRADEVVYDPNTGDIQPTGSIRLCSTEGFGDTPCF